MPFSALSSNVSRVWPDRRTPETEERGGPRRTYPWAPDDIVFRADLTAEEKRRCEAERPRTSQVVWPQAGMALDVPIGDRFFARAEGRLVLFDFRSGAGMRF